MAQGQSQPSDELLRQLMIQEARRRRSGSFGIGFGWFVLLACIACVGWFIAANLSFTPVAPAAPIAPSIIATQAPPRPVVTVIVREVPAALPPTAVPTWQSGHTNTGSALQEAPQPTAVPAPTYPPRVVIIRQDVNSGSVIVTDRGTKRMAP